jgi:hypothetical protein
MLHWLKTFFYLCSLPILAQVNGMGMNYGYILLNITKENKLDHPNYNPIELEE